MRLMRPSMVPSALLLLSATGCGSESSTTLVDGPSSTEPAAAAASAPASASADAITFRPVLAVCEGCADLPIGAGGIEGQTLPASDDPNNRYQVGSVLVDALAIERAEVRNDLGQWAITPVFRAGPAGIDRFNAAAAECDANTEVCPTGQLAIVIDGAVISAPSINEPRFERDQIMISGDFDEASAQALASTINAAGGG